jgi:hypothetical protein
MAQAGSSTVAIGMSANMDADEQVKFLVSYQYVRMVSIKIKIKEIECSHKLREFF